MRQAIKEIDNFYSPDVLFEDSMARCPWEAGVNVDDEEEAESDSTGPATEPEPESREQDFLSQDATRQSQWSGDSDSEMVFETHSAAAKHSWQESFYDDEESAATCDGRSASPESHLFSRRRFDDVRTASGPSTYSVVSSSPSIPSPPVTPGPDESLFLEARRPAHLTLDIDGLHNSYYDGSINMNMLSAGTESVMQTAIESARYSDFGPYSSFFYPESDKPSATQQSSDEIGMIITPTGYDYEDDDMDSLSNYSYLTVDQEGTSISMPEPLLAQPESPVLGLNLGFPSSEDSALESQSQPQGPYGSEATTASSQLPSKSPAYSFLTFSAPEPANYTAPFNFPPLAMPTPFTPVSTTLGSPFEYTPPASSSYSSKALSSRQSRSRSRKSRLLNPMRLAFTRRSRSPTPPVPRCFQEEPSKASFPTHWTLAPSIYPGQEPFSCFPTPESSPRPSGSSVTSTSVEKLDAQNIRRRATKKRLRSPRDWFSPGKLLAAVIPSP
jgi:hypothetical protein